MLSLLALRKLFERIGLIDAEEPFWSTVPREWWGRFEGDGVRNAAQQRDSIRAVQEQAEQYEQFGP